MRKMTEKKNNSRLGFSQLIPTSWFSNLRRGSTQPASTAANQPNLCTVSDISFPLKLNRNEESVHNSQRISCFKKETSEALVEFDFPRSSCGSCRSSISFGAVNDSDYQILSVGENQIPEPRMFSDMLSEIKRSRDLARKCKITPGNKPERRRSNESKDFAPRRPGSEISRHRTGEDQRITDRRKIRDENVISLGESRKKDLSSRKHQHRVSDSVSGKDKFTYLNSRKSDRGTDKGENQRRATLRSPHEHKTEIKVYSPMRGSKNAGVAESFAVAKCSSDPHRDFRESMVEMISENGIERPEELEDLLALYLSLNSGEYHDVIVEVFRQVWFESNRVCAS